MDTITIDELAKFFVRLNLNGYMDGIKLTEMAHELEDANRCYLAKANQTVSSLGESQRRRFKRDANLAGGLAEELNEQLCILIATTEGPDTGGTDGIEDMNPILVAAITNGYMDANAINYPALAGQMEYKSEVTGADRPDIAADPGK